MTQHPSTDGRQTQEKPLNCFGRWITALNIILDTTMEEVAGSIGYSKSSFSEATRGDGGVSRQNFNELLKAYQTLTEIKQVKLPTTWQFFLAMAWLGETDENYDLSVNRGAAEAIEHIEWLAEVIKERNRLRRENELLKKIRYKRDVQTFISQWEREMEELKNENAWLKHPLRRREVGDS
jgi:hypothetical protein